MYRRVMGGNQKRAKEVKHIAEAITRYMNGQGRSADTLEGITRWWITGQRLIEAEEDVREAIESLCHRGLVQRRTLADGTVLYWRAEERQEDY
jgi:hypothetical protein